VAHRALAYYQLTKPRITGLVLLTAAAGFYLGSPPSLDCGLLLHTLLGVALVSSGTNALNQWWERDLDAKMARTRNRPLPTGRIEPEAAFWFACSVSVIGIAYLALRVNALTASLAAVTLLLYVAVYTPLKRRTWLATLVGSIPGALPAVGGWAAACGSLAPEAWFLFAVLFFWQLPHFWALDWVCRDDYRAATLKTLGTFDLDGRLTAALSLAASVALVVASFTPAWLGLNHPAYSAGAALLGAAFLGLNLWFRSQRTRRAAYRLFLGSVAYLPFLLGLLMITKAEV
jgi:protoheme IX farnesyltransferase